MNPQHLPAAHRVRSIGATAPGTRAPQRQGAGLPTYGREGRAEGAHPNRRGGALQDVDGGRAGDDRLRSREDRTRAGDCPFAPVREVQGPNQAQLAKWSWPRYYGAPTGATWGFAKVRFYRPAP